MFSIAFIYVKELFCKDKKWIKTLPINQLVPSPKTTKMGSIFFTPDCKLYKWYKGLPENVGNKLNSANLPLELLYGSLWTNGLTEVGKKQTTRRGFSLCQRIIVYINFMYTLLQNNSENLHHQKYFYFSKPLKWIVGYKLSHCYNYLINYSFR